MLAHGFTVALMVELVHAGLASAASMQLNEHILDYQESIGAKKHLVLGLSSQTGPPQRSNSFVTG